ncbi:MAG: histidine kinase [Clostridium sp.]|nr:histidine kinase [Clostridium sp.]
MAGRMKIPASRSYTWLIYAIVWGIVWGYPAFTAIFVAVKAGSAVLWNGVLHAWAGILPFFLLFLLHRLSVRRLFMHRHIRVYILSVAGLLCLFGLFRHYWSEEIPRASSVQEHCIPPHGQPPGGKPFPGRDDAGRRQDTVGGQHVTPAPRPPRPAGHGPHGGVPMPLLLDLVIAVLMLGFDLSITLFARYQEELEKSRRLESAHVRNELEHLKAQVNPHFFMNMLNNIHGMVEKNPARAQVMIMELSKLMRYVLYEGAKPRTLLSKETDFIASYVELMRKRYSSRKVRISLELPEGNREYVFLPPLLFISVIENAFKHGISYQSPSFVEIRLYMEKDTLRLDCVNSVHRRPPKDGRTGGVGLANLRQRLQLLYGDGFMLDITEKDGKTYHVNLIIPCEYDTDTMHSR